MATRTSGAAAGAARAKEPQWEPAPPEEVAAWLNGKTPADLGALEQAGRALYPSSIRRLNPKSGELEQVRIMLRVPTMLEQAKSRIEALEWCGKTAKLEQRPTKDEAEQIYGAAYFDHIDTLFLLQRSIYDYEPMADGTHPPYMLAEELDKLHPKASLADAYARLSHLQAVEDPRIIELSTEQFVQAVLAIARVQNLSPLVVIDGRAHESFIVSMAERLAPSLTQ